jgi:polyhydroxyalkanoate synthesis regulator phasin
MKLDDQLAKLTKVQKELTDILETNERNKQDLKSYFQEFTKNINLAEEEVFEKWTRKIEVCELYRAKFHELFQKIRKYKTQFEENQPPDVQEYLKCHQEIFRTEYYKLSKISQIKMIPNQGCKVITTKEYSTGSLLNPVHPTVITIFNAENLSKKPPQHGWISHDA